MRHTWRLALLAMLALTGSACATLTAGPHDARQAGAPADLPPFKSLDSIQYGKDKSVPYEAGEYWSKVLVLINRHAGFVEASELQQAFNAADLFRVRDIGADGYIAFLVAKQSWFGGFWYVRLWKPWQSEGQKMNAMGGDFSHLQLPGILDGHKQCLDLRKAESDLEASGWRRVPFQQAPVRTSDNGPPPEDFGSPVPIKLMKGTSSSVTITYNKPSEPWATDPPGRTCVAGIFVEGNK